MVSNRLTDRRYLDELGTGTNNSDNLHLVTVLKLVMLKPLKSLKALKVLKTLKAFKTLKGLANGNWQNLMDSGVAGHGFGF
jgi:hypothetical protein